MLESRFIDVATQALQLTLLLSAPVVVAVALVGLTVSMLQAATQVQEQSLATLAKLIAAYLVLIVSGAWMLAQLCEFCRELFRGIEQVRL